MDKLLLLGPDPDSTAEMKKMLSAEFEVHDLGEPCYLIGMEITRDHWAGTVTLSQRQYILRILEKQQMTDAKPVATTIDPNVTLLKRTEAPNTCASLLYATVIGLLMYVAIGTRLDISFAVQTLSQFTQNPRPEHWIAVKRVLGTYREPPI